MLKGVLAIVGVIVLLMTLVAQLPISEYKKQNDREVALEILAIMKANVITRDNVDWGELEKDVEALFNSEKDELLYQAIFQILEQTNTGHSFYQSESPPKFVMHKTENCKQHSFVAVPVPSDIGYIKLNGFSGGEHEHAMKYIESIRAQMKAYNNSNIKGWILDLSDNTGGNMWPMLSGLAPLLSDGIHGYFAHLDGTKHSWSTKNGNSYINDQFVIGMADDTDINNQLPIAVITSQKTSSSGEAVLLSFKDKANVKTFGLNTCGMSTANKPFKLSNGAMLNVTTSTMMDSFSVPYGGEVQVDVETNRPSEEAVDWINSTQ